MRRITQAEWWEEAKRRSADFLDLQFVCPSCGHIQTPGDFVAAGVPAEEVDGKVGFSCIGCWLPECQEAFTGGPGPCNYAGGGLFRIAPVVLIAPGGKEHYVFDFAVEPLVTPTPTESE